MPHPAVESPHQPLSGCILCGARVPLNPTAAQAGAGLVVELCAAPSLALAASTATQATVTASATVSRHKLGYYSISAALARGAIQYTSSSDCGSCRRDTACCSVTPRGWLCPPERDDFRLASILPTPVTTLRVSSCVVDENVRIVAPQAHALDIALAALAHEEYRARQQQ